MVVCRTSPLIKQFEQQVTKLQYYVEKLNRLLLPFIKLEYYHHLKHMESSIGNVENADFPAVRDQRLSVGVLQQNMAKWGQLKNSRFRFIYLLQIFKHTTRKCKWLGDNEKIVW